MAATLPPLRHVPPTRRRSRHRTSRMRLVRHTIRRTAAPVQLSTTMIVYPTKRPRILSIDERLAKTLKMFATQVMDHREVRRSGAVESLPGPVVMAQVEEQSPPSGERFEHLVRSFGVE